MVCNTISPQHFLKILSIVLTLVPPKAQFNTSSDISLFETSYYLA